MCRSFCAHVRAQVRAQVRASPPRRPSSCHRCRPGHLPMPAATVLPILVVTLVASLVASLVAMVVALRAPLRVPPKALAVALSMALAVASVRTLLAAPRGSTALHRDSGNISVLHSRRHRDTSLTVSLRTAPSRPASSRRVWGVLPATTTSATISTLASTPMSAPRPNGR